MKKYLPIFLGILGVFLASFSFLKFNAFAYTFPSTNEQNKTGTNPLRTGVGPHVNVLSTDVGEVTLEFVMPYDYYACFEYRSDGENSQYGNIYPHPVVIGDYWYYYKCIKNETWSNTFFADEYVEVRLAVGGERDWDFDWTRFDVETIPFIRSAEILSPDTEEVTFGETIFSAILNDQNTNAKVQWAIRKGTCTASTGTIWGNVDGRKDPFGWAYDSDIFQYSFTTSADVCEWEPDDFYCFVFNTGGGIRLTRTFSVPNCDSDIDGIRDDIDKCPSTQTDSVSSSLGVNRHVWYGGEYFTTSVPAKKGTFLEQDSTFSINETHGCSCKQILNSISTKTEQSFEGHYKFGCSKSVMEDWINNRYYLETLTVPANLSSPSHSKTILSSENTYILKAYGVADAGDTIDFDAKYSITKRLSGDIWTDTVSGYVGYGPQLLDLYINGENIDWGTYNEDHTYWHELGGDDNTLSGYINDIYYPNNLGNLYLDLFVKLY